MAKYYGVKAGRQPGVYTSWDECKAQVDGYSNAQYKSFKTNDEAQAYVSGEAALTNESDIKPAANAVVPTAHTVVKPSSKKHLEVYVDGSYNKTTNQYGCGVYMIDAQNGSKSVILANGQCMAGGNNIEGEVFAAVHAANFAVEHGYQSMTIHHDYQGIASWADGSWSAKKSYTRNYADHMNTLRKFCDIEFNHVDGHTGNIGNECVDKLAKIACNVDLTNSEQTSLKRVINDSMIYNHTSVDMSSYSDNVAQLGKLDDYQAGFYSDGASSSVSGPCLSI